MKKILLLLLIFVLVLPLVGQGDSLTTTKITSKHKHQIALDVEFLGVALSYKRFFSSKIGIGLNIGGLFKAKFGIKEASFGFSTFGVGEVYNLSLFADFNRYNKFHYTIGIKYSYFTNIDVNKGSFYGIEAGLFYSLRIVEFGIKPILGFFDDSGGFVPDKGIILGTSLLVIKIPLSMW